MVEQSVQLFFGRAVTGQGPQVPDPLGHRGPAHQVGPAGGAPPVVPVLGEAQVAAAAHHVAVVTGEDVGGGHLLQADGAVPDV